MPDHCIFSKLLVQFHSKPLCTLSQAAFLLECDGSKAQQDDCPFWYRPMGTIEPNDIELPPEVTKKVRAIIKKVRSKKDALSL